MAQKTVSFEVAKALKEAGYPQPQTDVWGYVNRPNNCYFTGRHYYWDENHERQIEWDETNQFHTIDDWADEIEPSFYGSAIAAPTYLDVWLWLWREKRITLEPSKEGILVLECEDENGQLYYSHNIYSQDENKDPVEAIIAAIDFLVENNLIK